MSGISIQYNGEPDSNDMETNSSTPRESRSPPLADDAIVELEASQRSAFRSEDLWAIWLGWAVLMVAVAATWLSRPEANTERVAQYEELTRQADALHESEGNPDRLERIEAERTELRSKLAHNPLKPWLAKRGSWRSEFPG